MPDIVDRATRSRMMAGYRNQEHQTRTRPSAGYARPRPQIPPAQSETLQARRTSCFADSKPCASCTAASGTGMQGAAFRPPRQRAWSFWQAKFEANVDRDRRKRAELLEAGWRVAVVWECALRKGGEVGTASELEHWLRGNSREFETSPGAEVGSETS